MKLSCLPQLSLSTPYIEIKGHVHRVLRIEREWVFHMLMMHDSFRYVVYKGWIPPWPRPLVPDNQNSSYTAACCFQLALPSKVSPELHGILVSHLFSCFPWTIYFTCIGPYDPLRVNLTVFSPKRKASTPCMISRTNSWKTYSRRLHVFMMLCGMLGNFLLSLPRTWMTC